MPVSIPDIRHGIHELRNLLIQFILKIGIRIAACHFCNISQKGGHVFIDRIDFPGYIAGFSQLVFQGNPVLSLRQIKQIRLPLAIRDGYALPFITVGKGIFLYLLKGNDTVNGNLPVDIQPFPVILKDL